MLIELQQERLGFIFGPAGGNIGRDDEHGIELIGIGMTELLTPVPAMYLHQLCVECIER